MRWIFFYPDMLELQSLLNNIQGERKRSLLELSGKCLFFLKIEVF